MEDCVLWIHPNQSPRSWDFRSRLVNFLKFPTVLSVINGQREMGKKIEKGGKSDFAHGIAAMMKKKERVLPNISTVYSCDLIGLMSAFAVVRNVIFVIYSYLYPILAMLNSNNK